MSVFEGTVYSESLRMMTQLCVCLPQGSKGRSPYAQCGETPVLYLLHGLSDNHTAWLRRTRVDYYAERAGIAVVMPEVQRSFYFDMHYGLDYFTYLSEELPALCRQLFRLSSRREENFVAGFSMGGYGALKTALRRPDRFGGAASFSGALDLKGRMNGDSLLSAGEVEAISGGQVGEDDDLFALSREVGRAACPPLYITCGEEDFLLEDNRRFRRHLDELGIAHNYEEWPGEHCWEFWEESIRRSMDWFSGLLPPDAVRRVKV